MEIIILKSAACLALLLVFYKLLLENLAIHKFKRFYLLGALAVSFIIPFITFIKYVEPTLDFGSPEMYGNFPPYFPVETMVLEPEPINYLPIILWSVYGLGVTLFLIRFCVNLFGIVSKIKNHTKVKNNRFVNVLMEQLETPHTFLNYIFLNKNKFENNQIPTEVLLHEQTHAKQKHSLDILFLELIQIVFWFNPLLFWLKKEVKLNHEFLADQDVINQGVDTKLYQNILLQFSSNQQDYALSNAINYSSIKKRFTIMKTQTPKPTVWLRSLLLLPLLGLLIYSFSSIEEVEKEVTPAMLFQDEKEANSNNILKEIETDLKKKGEFKINYVNPILEVKTKPLTLILNGKKTTLNSLEVDFNAINKNKKTSVTLKSKDIITTELIHNLQKHFGANLKSIDVSIQDTKVVDENSYSTKNGLHELLPTINYGVYNSGTLLMTKKEIENLILGSNSKQKITSYKLIIPTYPALTINGNTLNDKAKEWLKNTNNGMVLLIRDLKTEEASIDKNIQILIKDESKTSQEAILLVNGIECDKCELFLTRKEISDLTLTTNSNKTIKSFNFKVPGQPTVRVTGNKLNPESLSILRRTNIGTIVQLFNIKSDSIKFGPVIINLVEKNSGEAIPPPPSTPATPKEDASQQTKRFKEGRVKMEAIKSNRLEPSTPPKSTLDHVVDMAKKDASFSYNEKAITSDEAIELIKNNKEINISSQTNNGNSTVAISNKPIHMVNGKLIENELNDCLDFNKTIDFKQQNTTLKISCIKEYPNNVLKIFDRWGVLVYSKKGYDNSWDGTLDKKLTNNENSKIQTGTYYYVLITGTKEDPTTGPLYIL